MVFFYDSYCPLCVAEVNQLIKYDAARRIQFVDIHCAQQLGPYPFIDPIKANQRLHVLDENGHVHTGLDATCLVWARVNKHLWLQVLRWPLIRWVADLIYVIFARYRYSISYLLTGKKRCERCEKL